MCDNGSVVMARMSSAVGLAVVYGIGPRLDLAGAGCQARAAGLLRKATVVGVEGLPERKQRGHAPIPAQAAINLPRKRQPRP